MRKRTLLRRRWDCIFKNPIAHDRVDPEVKRMFEVAGEKPSYGDLRQTWRRHHCAILNPYGSEDCPYAESECASAFLSAISETLLAEPRSIMGLFGYVARRTGAERADAAQGSRHRRRVLGGGGAGQRPEVQGAVGALPDPGRRREDQAGVPGVGDPEPVHGSRARPTRIGSVLGTLDLGSRPPHGGRDQGREGSE